MTTIGNDLRSSDCTSMKLGDSGVHDESDPSGGFTAKHAVAVVAAMAGACARAWRAGDRSIYSESN